MKKKSPLYFRRWAERAYPIEKHIADMKAEGVTEREFFQAVPDRNTGYFYCTKYDELGSVGTCGKTCDNYDPRNGKSGICSYHRSPVSPDVRKRKTIKL